MYAYRLYVHNIRVPTYINTVIVYLLYYIFLFLSQRELPMHIIGK